MPTAQHLWDRLGQLAEVMPGHIDPRRLLIALAILGLALALRKPVASLALRVLRRLLRHRPDAGAVIDALHPPAQVLAPLVGLVIVNETVLLNDRLRVIGHDMARTLILLCLFWALYRAIRPLLTRLETRSAAINASMLGVAVAGMHLVVLALGAAAILEVWGIHVGPVLAGFGLVGAAVALGAQDLFRNLIGGIFIIVENRFQDGDWISSDGICEGTVEAIGLRSTRLRQFDLAPIYVPNAKLSDTPVVNHSRMINRRIDWQVGITYETGLPAMKAFRDDLAAYLHGCGDFVETAAAPIFVRIDTLGDSAVNLLVYCFTKTTDWDEWLQAKERLACRIVELARAHEVGLAYPSQSLYVETLPPWEGAPASRAAAAQAPAG